VRGSGGTFETTCEGVFEEEEVTNIGGTEIVDGLLKGEGADEGTNGGDSFERTKAGGEERASFLTDIADCTFVVFEPIATTAVVVDDEDEDDAICSAIFCLGLHCCFGNSLFGEELIAGMTLLIRLL